MEDPDGEYVPHPRIDTPSQATVLTRKRSHLNPADMCDGFREPEGNVYILLSRSGLIILA